LTWTAYPFDGQTTTEDQYTRFLAEVIDSGVVDGIGGAALAVSADASGMTVTLAPGTAIVRGHVANSDAPHTVTIAGAAALPRIDRIVLRLDSAANAIAPAVIKGEPGGPAPVLTQTKTGIFELPLAQVTVPADAVAIAAGDVADDRRFTSGRVGVWTTATRPTAPRRARLGFNTDAERWEHWNGTEWVPAVRLEWTAIENRPEAFPPASHSHPWSEITSKPTTFAPATHSHPWSAVTGKPATFTPSEHQHHWSDINGTPATFPPRGHLHSWAEVTGKPTAYPPSAHTHPEYVETSGTVARANGTTRVHNHLPQGGSVYQVWVDANRNFCRNVSSARYKRHIRTHRIAAEAVMALRPVLYDMKPSDDDASPATNLYGLIAEEVAEHVPELVTRNESGQPEAVRYDLLSVALLDVVRDQYRDLAALREQVDALQLKRWRWWPWRKFSSR
jgi:hypothetical protein